MNSIVTDSLMKDENPFIYLAAHDLRAPLMSIKGLINLMRQEPERENLEQYFDLLEKSVDKVDQSINEIINYSKKGESAAASQPVDLKNILQEAIQILRYMDGADAVHIEVIVEEGGLFFSDQNLLFCVFSNIISNAIRYHDPEKADPYLRIELTFNKEGAHLIFGDNGIGIDKSLHNKIFDKFFLVNQDHNGTGLGLYAVKSCADKLGGKISVESIVGEGTRFHLYIPNLMSKVNTF